MSFFKTLAGLVGGATLGLLFAQKDGKKLRTALKGKKGADIAEILGKELTSAGKDLVNELEKLSDSDQIQALSKMGQTKLEAAMKLAKKEMESLQDTASKEMTEVKKQVKKAALSAKKSTKKQITSTTKKAKKTISRAQSTLKKTLKK